MDEEKKLFESISSKLTSMFPDVAPGKMLSSPAITINGKVFAFFTKDKMVFRLGKNFDPEKVGLKKWQHLNLFKDKPPMRSWFVVPREEKDKWLELADLAHEYVTTVTKF